jgi:signal transduction histidine kinase
MTISVSPTIQQLPACVAQSLLTGRWFLAAGSRQLSWTEEMQQLHGMDPQTQPAPETPEAWAALAHANDRHALLRLLTSEYDACELTYRAFCPDSSLVWLRIYAQPAYNEAGKFMGLCGTLQDVSRLKRRGPSQIQALESMHAELASFNHLASHDLMEPLRKIRTFISLLRSREPQLSAEALDYFNRMQSAAIRMEHMIEGMLQYATISSAREHPIHQDLDILFRQVMASQAIDIRSSNARIDYEPLPIAPVIPDQFLLLAGHLLSNALKFHAEGKNPHIIIRHQYVNGQDPDVNGLQPGQAYLLISIRDHGIGIAPGHADRIFGMFQRLNGRQAYAGAGMGLAICRRIVHNHEGLLLVTSEAGAGATFQLYLPTENPDEA